MKKTMMMMAAVALSCAFTAHADTWYDGVKYTYTYTVAGSGAVLQKVTPKPTGAYTIPNTLGGVPVTEIAASAFYLCEDITSVVIPESVTRIGAGAFYDCVQMQSVTLPQGLTEIGDSAFANCVSLDNVVIPPGVTRIELQTFGYCWSLVNITLPAGVTYIGDDAFVWCSHLADITIPPSVTHVGVGAFYGTEFWLQQPNNSFVYLDGWLVGINGIPAGSVTVAAGTVGVAAGAFCWNNGITDLTILPGVKYICDDAFAFCFGLKSVTLPGGIAILGARLFTQDNVLTNVVFTGNAPAYVNPDIYKEAPSGLRTTVPPGSKGWDGNPNSTALPSSGQWYGRPIRHAAAPAAPLTITDIALGIVFSGKQYVTLFFDHTVPIDYNSVRVRVWERLDGASTREAPLVMQSGGKLFVNISVNAAWHSAFFRIEAE